MFRFVVRSPSSRSMSVSVILFASSKVFPVQSVVSAEAEAADTRTS